MAEPCPSPERWKEHLDGTLPVEEHASLAEHLEGCAACRRTLDNLAGGGDSLLDVARLAGQKTEAATPELDDVVAHFQAPASETQAELAASPDDALAFLTPAGKPDCLGRLGHYEIQQVIGKGGFGTVFKAFDPRLHRVVAIKALSPVYAANGSARKRFIREAQAVAAVKNEHVVGIHDVQADAQPPYFVMELIDGISLQEKLDRHGALGVKEILRIGMQIAEGLAAAHKQGKIHRDIKPANILLENGVERVKITDFGLARAVDDASVTQSGTVAGTPMYMSPEQAEGLAIDHRSDLFSLGSVLYAMCTGHPPFRASGTHAVLKRVIDAAPRPIRQINSEIPDWLEGVIGKLHAKKPDDRFQSAREVAEALGQGLAYLQQPGTAAPVAPEEFRKAVEAYRAQAEVAGFDAVPTATPASAGAAAAPARRRSWLVALPILAGVFVVALVMARRHWTPDPDAVPPSKGVLPALVTPPEEAGWVRLFNGKDVPGTAETQPDSWKVLDGVLVGSGARGLALLKVANDLQDFHCRIEAKVVGRALALVDFRRSGPASGQAVLESKYAQRRAGSLGFYVAPKPGVTLVHWDKPPAAPDGWFTIEIIAVSKKVTIKVDGVTTAKEQEIPDLPKRGDLALAILDKGVTVEFRKIEIRELALPAETAPFVLLSREGKTERKLASLAEAVAAAQSGDSIEIRGNGPFAIEPIDVKIKAPVPAAGPGPTPRGALCLRAASGFRPVLTLAPESKASPYLLKSSSNLILEGVELRREGLADWDYAGLAPRLIQMEGADLFAANCRFVVDLHGTGIFAGNSKTIRLRNCEYLTSGKGPAFLLWGNPAGGTGPGEVVLQNCTAVGGYSLLRVNYRAPAAETRVAIQGCTAVVERSPLWFFSPAWPLDVEKFVKQPIRFETAANVFKSADSLIQFNHVARPASGGPAPLADLVRILPRLMTWRGESNAYNLSLGVTYTYQPVGGGREQPLKRIDLGPGEWKASWGEETGSDAKPILLAAKDPLLKVARDPASVVPQDLGLDPKSPGGRSGGKDLGAEADVVGPGEAYAKWKKTTVYQEWRKAADALTAGAPWGEVGLRVRRAWELVDKGPTQYDEARKEFAAALALEPEHAQAHAGIGYVFASQKNLVDAERHAALALFHGAGDYLVLHNVACIYATCGVADAKQERRYQDMALDQLRRAVALWSETKMGPNEIDLIRAEPAFPKSMRDRADFKALIGK